MFLKEVIWLLDEFGENEVLFVLDGIFGCFLGEVLDCNWIFFCFVNINGFWVCWKIGVLDFLFLLILFFVNVICLGMFGLFIWFYWEKDVLLNCFCFCCIWGCFLCFCFVSFFRGRFVMFSLYIVLVIILVNVFIVICK